MDDLEQMLQGAELVFDRQVLMRQTHQDSDLAAEVLTLFFDHLNRLERSDWSNLKLSYEMHTLQGAAASVGASQIEQLSANWRNQGQQLEEKLLQAARAFRTAAQTF
jgi:hypothetical protein